MRSPFASHAARHKTTHSTTRTAAATTTTAIADCDGHINNSNEHDNNSNNNGGNNSSNADRKNNNKNNNGKHKNNNNNYNNTSNKRRRQATLTTSAEVTTRAARATTAATTATTTTTPLQHQQRQQLCFQPVWLERVCWTSRVAGALQAPLAMTQSAAYKARCKARRLAERAGVQWAAPCKSIAASREPAPEPAVARNSPAASPRSGSASGEPTQPSAPPPPPPRPGPKNPGLRCDFCGANGHTAGVCRACPICRWHGHGEEDCMPTSANGSQVARCCVCMSPAHFRHQCRDRSALNQDREAPRANAMPSLRSRVDAGRAAEAKAWQPSLEMAKPGAPARSAPPSSEEEPLADRLRAKPLASRVFDDECPETFAALQGLERELADYDGSRLGLAFASGSAALATVLASLLCPGERCLVCFTGGQRAAGLLELLGRPFTFVDARDAGAVFTAARLQAKTRVILTFAPRPPIFSVVDLPALAGLASDINAFLVYDCGRDGPEVLEPLELGVHAAIREFGKAPRRVQRGTQAVIPGGETIGAAVVFRSPAAAQAVEHGRALLGSALSQGLVADVREAAGFQSRRAAGRCMAAADIADLLAAQREVSSVCFHGHSSHEQHALASQLHSDGLFGSTVAAFLREPALAGRLLQALREPWAIGAESCFSPSTAFLLEGGGIALRCGDEPSDILCDAILDALDRL